jgi:hypothetical protein
LLPGEPPCILDIFLVSRASSIVLPVLIAVVLRSSFFSANSRSAAYSLRYGKITVQRRVLFFYKGKQTEKKPLKQKGKVDYSVIWSHHRSDLPESQSLLTDVLMCDIGNLQKG